MFAIPHRRIPAVLAAAALAAGLAAAAPARAPASTHGFTDDGFEYALVVPGPDHGSYRVDTYIVNYTPTNGRAVKWVTVVVRNSGSLKTLARNLSTFDQATG